MSHAFEQLVGKFDLVQRSLLFIYVQQKQEPNSKCRLPRHVRQAINPTCSSRMAVHGISQRVFRSLEARTILGACLECLVHGDESCSSSTIKACFREANQQTAELFALYEAHSTGRTRRHLEVVLSIEDATE